MTDQDNLRDRIEEVIWKRTTLPTEITMLVAQAIIDELGLTVEEANDYGDRTERHGILRFGVKTRVVGKWEKQ